MASDISVVKGHGLGNDYVVLREAQLSAPLQSASIIRICDRNLGVGSDGILLHTTAITADFGLRIFNPDGSEAEKSGNGLRIFAKYLWDHGYAKKLTFTVETPGGVVECRVHQENGRCSRVTVEMGTATFAASEIPVTGVVGDAVSIPVEVSGQRLNGTAVSVGNPHFVIFAETLDEAICRQLGPSVENHPMFPNRTNVQFARARDRSNLEILIWERGAGYTLASGSSSCAAAAAAVREGRCDHGPVTVHMPGGTLAIEVRPDWSLLLEGPVEEVFVGALSREFVRDYLV